MSAALDQQARTALEQFVQRARQLLEDDLAREAEGRFGIHSADGQVEDEEGLHLDPTGLIARRDMVDILEFLRREEGSGSEAIARLIREAAFTHLNRIIAIRIAEALGLLPESLVKGRSSVGFKELLEVAPLLATDASGGYWRYLQLCGDELAADLPQLFDPRNPLLALAPSTAACDELVEMIGAGDLDSVWDATDALGWAYQFFNSGDERRAMRELSASPRNSRELAVRNQFFTPRYVVDFLVHNSLGRRLLEANPSSRLLDDLPLLLDPPTEAGEPIQLTEVRVLDPACGSGHFLLGAYDVLERAWELEGVMAEDAAPHIVSSLWGIDIDSRCAQVAAAAVILRARRHSKKALPRPNIITARSLPEPNEGWDAVLESLPPDRRHLVTSMRDALEQAPLLGPLLKVEEFLAAEIRARVVGATNDDSTLFGALGVATDAFGEAEQDVLEVIQHVADSAESSAAERLLAAESQDAIRFVEAMRHRYDAVLMNPPFGEPVAATKNYLRASYPWIPTRDYNLLAVFVGRGLELCSPSGYLGAITSRVGLFLKTFEDWRVQVLLGRHLVTLADLGYGVMEQALVEAAAYVVGSAPAKAGDHATFVRLLRDSDRPRALKEALAASRARTHDSRLSTVELADFHAVPGSPIAYWVAPSVRRLFRDIPALEDEKTSVRVGLQTGDDFRFVRLFWEVALSRIGRARADTLEGRRWVPFSKGGEYSPYWSDIHLLVDWARDGEAIRSYPGARPQNLQFFFRSGLTWPRRTASGFGVRLLPEGVVFSDQAPSGFSPDDQGTYALLAWTTSRLVRVLLDGLVAAGDETTSGGAARAYQAGRVQVLPGGNRLLGDRACDESAVLAQLQRAGDLYDETTRSFVGPFMLLEPDRSGSVAAASLKRTAARTARSIEMLTLHARLETEIHEAVGLDTDAVRYVDDEAGRHPTHYDVGVVDDAEFAALWTAPIDQLVDTVVELRGGSRAVTNLTFIADRRLEVIAHALERPPQQLEEMRERLALLPPEEPRMSTDDLVSYLVGAAFGRWDVRISAEARPADQWPNLLDLVRVCPPGMLVGADGLPTAKPPSGYPLEVPAGGILVDEPGHRWDIEAAVEAAAAACLDEAATVLVEVIAVLGRRTVREYLRKDFFKDHLSRYSRSRRKAPIYWPLTVPSGHWAVWVYAPMLSRETLYAIASEALRRERHAEAEMTRLERERASGGAGRGVKALDKALDTERRLAEELRRFREEADRIAGLGWEPDLDDGTVLCTAPLADLFPVWKEPAQYRKELRAGKYEWAAVARWADRL